MGEQVSTEEEQCQGAMVHVDQQYGLERQDQHHQKPIAGFFEDEEAGTRVSGRTRLRFVQKMGT